LFMANRVFGGRYAVQDKIGTGGMATVYRGLDQVLGRTVAIKTMLPQYAADPSFAARFKQEAQAAAALQSPYIVSVYDWGKDGDTYYIIMEYLRGTDLKNGIRRHGALDCRKVAQIGSQIAQALAVAHKHGIIHRDIKPQNIMVQPDGNIKVMDFGIAHSKNSHLTADNSVLGTAHYVSPEQTQGKELGPTSDLYSLGIVMYEAATGRVPFDGDDAISVAIKQVKEQPIPPSQINPKVDPGLEAIILKCMQKNPDDRFQTADELYHTLRDYLAGRLSAVDAATRVMGEPPTRRLNNASADTTQRLGRTTPVRPVKTSSRSQHSAAKEKKEKAHRRNMIIGIIVAIAAVAAIAFAAVNYIGQLNAQQVVPNLVGLSEDDARKTISQTNGFFNLQVTYDYSDSVDQGTVIDQDPDAGRSESQGTTITIHVSKGKEPAASVEVPDLTNLTPNEASAALQKVGLVAQAGDSVYSNSVAAGHIVSQDTAAGTTAKAGDTITYHLSLGVESVTVPNVVGQTEAAATAAIRNAGLIASSTATEYSNTVPEGSVIRQYPGSGSVNRGSTITLTISKGPEPHQNNNKDNNTDNTITSGNNTNTGGNTSGQQSSQGRGNQSAPSGTGSGSSSGSSSSTNGNTGGSGQSSGTNNSTSGNNS
jgi:serine/threonine protein kinase